MADEKEESQPDLLSRNTRRQESELATTGTKDVHKSKKCTPQKKLVPVVVLLVATIGIIAYAVLDTTLSECDVFLQDISAGNQPSVALDPVSMGECYDSACSFDISQCDTDCPFGYARNKETRCEETCECAMEGSFQGDIAFSESQLSKMMRDYGHTVADDFELLFGWGGNIWNNIEVDGRFKIPYVLDRTFTDGQYKVFDAAIRNLSRHICLDYIPRLNNERDHIMLSSITQACETHVGRVGSGQLVSLGPGCFFEATIQHELAHTLGFDHEQCRPDRDAHVDIHWDNIQKRKKHNFNKRRAESLTDLQSPYELGSAMHYDSFAFTIKTLKPAVTGKGNVLIEYEMREHFLTEEDIREINLLYGCKEPGPTKVGEWDPWNDWSECTKTCGSGRQSRFRYCIYRKTGEKLASGCDGLPSSFLDCNTEECPPTNATWTEWGPWGKCSTTCDKGRRTRGRDCTIVLGCMGDFASYYQSEDCWVADCATGEKITTYTFAQWGEWSSYWTHCDKTCGKGHKRSSRDCMWKGEPLRPDRCAVDETEPGVNKRGNFRFKECERRPCFPTTQASTTSSPPAVTSSSTLGFITQSPQPNQHWGEWGQWSRCSASCGQGMKKKVRTCPVDICPGSGVMVFACVSTECSLQPEPENTNQWGEWTQWSKCDRTCGNGVRGRTRKCGGSYCPGQASYLELCELDMCSYVTHSSGWGEWGQWSPCDKTCGTGRKSRSRRCKAWSCSGARNEGSSCRDGSCPSASANIFEETSRNVVKNVCPYGKLFPGKFNRDNAVDLLCLYPDGFVRLYFTNPTRGSLADEISWEGPTTHCGFEELGQQTNMHVRDMNNDGLDDLVCHNQYTKEIMVTYNKGGNFRPQIDWKGLRGRCESTANFEDLDGDRNIDLVCGDETNPIKYIYHRENQGLSKFRKRRSTDATVEIGTAREFFSEDYNAEKRFNSIIPED